LQSLRWREANQIDTLLQDFTLPEIAKQYLCLNNIGVDKEGSPLLIYQIGKCDFKGLYSCLSLNELEKILIWVQEESLQAMRDQTKKLGKNIESHYFVVDCAGLSFKQVTYRPTIELQRRFAKLLEGNYPEILKKVKIINASKLFYVMFALVKPFIDHNTIGKIQFCGDDWKQILLKEIDADVLPEHWGGTRTDGSGKPWCPNVLPEGGLVPKELLRSYHGDSRLADVPGTSVLKIASGSSALVEAEIDTPKSILKWIFGTENYNIDFGVYRKTAEGLEEHIPKERVKSHVTPEEGELECPEIGTYLLEFDNTTSLWRTKKVTYRVEVLPPAETGLSLPSQINL